MRVRTRSRSDASFPHYSISGSWRSDVDGPMSYPYQTTSQTIVDWVGKRADGGRLPSSPCSDIRAEFFPAEMGPWSSYWTGSRLAQHSSGHFSWDPSSFIADLFSRSSDGASLAYKAWDAFSDQVPEEISLGNFALEWRDAVDLIPSLIENFVRAAPAVKALRRDTKSRRRDNKSRRKPRKPDKERSPRGGSSVTEDAASGFLGWNFALAPLIGDLEALAGLAHAVRARLEYIRSINGKTTVLNYRSYSPTPTIPFIAPTVGLWIPGGSDVAPPVATLRGGTGVFTARCRLSVQIPERELDGMIGLTRTFIGATGLNNPLSIIWNAIPFSFVLDWFLRFSDMLSRRKVKPFTGEWRVRDFTWSLKQTTHWTVDQPWMDAPFHWSATPLHRGTIRVTNYQRGLGLPETEVGSLLKGACTPKQAALLLALSR